MVGLFAHHRKEDWHGDLGIQMLLKDLHSGQKIASMQTELKQTLPGNFDLPEEICRHNVKGAHTCVLDSAPFDACQLHAGKEVLKPSDADTDSKDDPGRDCDFRKQPRPRRKAQSTADLSAATALGS